MLGQMRMACDHPFLVLARPGAAADLSKIGQTLLRRWRETQRSQEQAEGGDGGGGSGGGGGPFGGAPASQAVAPAAPSEAFLHSTLQQLQRQQRRQQRPPSRIDVQSADTASAASALAAGGAEGGSADEEAVGGGGSGGGGGGDAGSGTCVICLEVFEDPVLTSCAHQFCRECIMGCLGPSLGAAPCPVCRVPVRRHELISLPTYENSRFAVDLDNAWRPSSKLTALTDDLRRTLATPLPPVDPKAMLPAGFRPPRVRKAVIVSQWTSMLDLIERVITAEKLTFDRLDGSLSQAQRSATLKRFEEDEGVVVLLLSLRAGGVGINLVAAQTIYLCAHRPPIRAAVQRPGDTPFPCRSPASSAAAASPRPARGQPCPPVASHSFLPSCI